MPVQVLEAVIYLIVLITLKLVPIVFDYEMQFLVLNSFSLSYGLNSDFLIEVFE